MGTFKVFIPRRLLNCGIWPTIHVDKPLKKHTHYIELIVWFRASHAFLTDSSSLPIKILQCKYLQLEHALNWSLEKVKIFDGCKHSLTVRGEAWTLTWQMYLSLNYVVVCKIAEKEKITWNFCFSGILEFMHFCLRLCRHYYPSYALQLSIYNIS